jgi:hypothetical protein
LAWPDEDGYLTSPAIALAPPTEDSGAAVILSWWQFLVTEAGHDFASVEVVRDAGI